MAQLPAANGVDPLAGLKDIYLPEPVALWPPAPGWWLLSVLILLVAIFGLIAWQRQRRRNRYRVLAKRELDELLAGNGDNGMKAQAVNQLLKRVAIIAYPSLPLASWSGHRWLRLLSSTHLAPDNEELKELLAGGIYARTSPSQQQLLSLVNFARLWLQNHVNESNLKSHGEL